MRGDEPAVVWLTLSQQTHARVPRMRGDEPVQRDGLTKCPRQGRVPRMRGDEPVAERAKIRPWLDRSSPHARG